MFCGHFLLTAREVSECGVFSGSYFLAFGLNAETYIVNLRIQSKCGKIRTRKIWHLATVQAVVISNMILTHLLNLVEVA